MSLSPASIASLAGLAVFALVGGIVLKNVLTKNDTPTEKKEETSTDNPIERTVYDADKTYKPIIESNLPPEFKSQGGKRKSKRKKSKRKYSKRT